jgi:serpin B
MKKLLYLLILVFVVTGCEKQKSNNQLSEPVKITLNAPEQTLENSGKYFTFSLLSSVIEAENSEENISISPFSLNSVLAMAMNGASGDTKDSIKRAMGFGNLSDTEINTYFKKVKETVLITDQSAKIIIANSLWYKQEATIEIPFANINKTYFDSEIRPIDFSDQNNVNVINKWCSDNTNGLINNVIVSIKKEDFMYLINALYFKAPWQKGYAFEKDKTVFKPFSLPEGGSVQTKMMIAENDVLHYSDANLSMISIPYGNGAFSMLLFLPAQNSDPVKTAAKLSEESYLNTIIAQSYKKRVRMEIPKFKFRYDVSLNDILKSRGMAIAYNPLTADFSHAFSGVSLFISDVKQFNYINVDEEGTEAAAVTVITVGITSIPQIQDFILNRPFLFAIRENTSGVILFAGKVGNPVNSQE